MAAQQPSWASVNFESGMGVGSSQVDGPGAANSVQRPAAGVWQAKFGLANHFANLQDYRIKVYEADTITFHDYFIASGHAGMNSHFVLKMDLSEPVRRVTWELPTHSRDLSNGAKLTARYSTDGKAWREAYRYPPGRSDEAPPPAVLDFKPPTRQIYVGWFAEVPQGENGYWNVGDSGTFTFVASGDGNRATTKAAGSTSKTADYRTLQGPRFVPNGLFATTTHGIDEHTAEELTALNIRNARVDFPLSNLSSSPPGYDIRPDDPLLRVAGFGYTDSINLLPILHPIDDLERAEALACAMAAKYKGEVRDWQIGNEPDMAVWKVRFVDYLKACYRGIKRGNPDARVVLPGFAGNEALHLEAIYRYGGKGYFDVIASHSYTRPNLPEKGGYLGKILSLHEVMTRHGDDKPLFVTEMGWNGVEPSMLEYLRAKNAGYRSYACTEEDQARGLARLYLLSATVPWIERVYFFHLNQEAAYTDSQHENADWYMGIVGPGAMPGTYRMKDAYWAVKTVVDKLSESNYVKRLDLGDNVWALVFERGGEEFVALWSLSDGVSVALKDVSCISGITSMVGTPVLVTADALLGISGRPIYISAKPGKMADLESQLLKAKWRDPDQISATVELDTQRTAPGKPVLAVKLTNHGRQAQVAPPLRIQPASPWRADVSWIEDKKPLAPGEVRKHLVELTGPRAGAGEVSMELTTALARPPAEDESLRLHYLSVPYRAKGFAIDGNLNDWSGVPGVELGKSAHQRQLPGWRGAEDCSAKWYCAWNERELFWAAEVRDDAHSQPAAATNSDGMWSDDSVQIALDTAGDAQPSSNNPHGFDGVNDVEFGLALGDDGKSYVHFWANPRGKVGPISLDKAKIVRDDKKKITRYEIAMPWSMMGLAKGPTVRWMGMNVLINDNDASGRRGWLEWAPGIGYRKDPGSFPKLLLQGKPGRK